jgi:hypothetical protein
MSKPILLSKIAINQLDSLPDDIRNRVKKALYALSGAEMSKILDTKKLILLNHINYYKFVFIGGL